MVTTKRRRDEAIFRAISDPTRRQVLSLLRNGQMTVGDVAGHFRMSRPAVSKHIRILTAARLIVINRAGAARICKLNAEPLRIVDNWLQDYEVFWSKGLRDLKQYVEENP